MSEEAVQNLLQNLPSAGEVRDPREGEHASARVSEVELVGPFSSGDYGIQVTFSGLMDTEGREFQHKARHTIPTSGSKDFIRRMFLAATHEYGIVPRENKEGVIADTAEARTQIHEAFKTVVGKAMPLKLAADRKGFMRERFSPRG